MLILGEMPVAQTTDRGAQAAPRPQPGARAPVSLPRAIVLLLSLGLVYVMSHFYRTALAVIAPEVGADLALSPAELGVLNGAFFVAFAVTQVPVGVMLDRFGPRRVISGMMLVTVAGTALTGLSSSYELALLGRLMQGAGCCSVLMGSFVVFARWFPQRYFATLSATVMFIGGLGNLLSAAPLAYGAQSFGWRESFLFSGALTLLLVVQLFLVVRDSPPGTPPPTGQHERLGQVLAGLLAVLKNRNVPLLFVMNFVAYAAVITVIGLWAGPYLADVHGLDTDQRGNVLTLVHVAVGASLLLVAPMDRWIDTRKWVVFTASGGCILLFLTLGLVPGLSLTTVVVLLVLLGPMSLNNIILMTHGRALFPVERVGRGMSVLNVGVFAGVATLQTLSGWLIQQFPTVDGRATEGAYQAVFLLCAGALAVGLCAYAFVPDAKPSQARD